MNKALRGVAAAAVLITAAAADLIYGSAEEKALIGNCGENAVWSFDETTGVLTISGTGDMYTNYVPVDQWGYYPYREEITEVVVEEGITSVGGCAFGKMGNYGSEKTSEYTHLTKVTLPSTVREIKDYAFYRSALTTVTFPEGLETIGEAAFYSTPLSGELTLPQSLKELQPFAFQLTKISSVNLHEGMALGGNAFRDCDALTEVTIPGNMVFGATPTSNAPRPNGGFAHCDSLEKVIIQGGGEVLHSNIATKDAIGEELFNACPSLKEVEIETEDIAYVSEMKYYPAYVENKYEESTFDLTNTPTFKVYKGSTTEKTLQDAGYLTEDNTLYYDVDVSKLEDAVSRAEEADTNLYTEESAGNFTSALEKAEELLQQELPLPSKVDEAATELNDAIDALEYKPADYTAVDNALETVPSDLSIYTEETVKALQDAMGAVDRTKNITEQTEVDAYAKAVKDAIAGLVKKQPATPLPPPTEQPATPTAKPGGSAEQGTVQEKTAQAIRQAKGTKLKVKKKTKKTVKLTWKKINKATGYQVCVAGKKSFKKTLLSKKTKKNTVTIRKKRKSKKTYYVRVRAYYTYKDSRQEKHTVYSKWSKKCKVIIK